MPSRALKRLSKWYWYVKIQAFVEMLLFIDHNFITYCVAVSKKRRLISIGSLCDPSGMKWWRASELACHFRLVWRFNDKVEKKMCLQIRQNLLRQRLIYFNQLFFLLENAISAQRQFVAFNFMVPFNLNWTTNCILFDIHLAIPEKCKFS